MKVTQRRQEKFSRVTAVVLAVGSSLTFNPGWVTGMCWCAEEGQEGTLFPRPLRRHAGKTAEQRLTGGGEGKSQPPQAYLRGTDSLLGSYVDSHMHHIHVQALFICTAAQRSRLGNAQTEGCI